MVLDSSARVAPYRILLQTADSQIYWNIACGESFRPRASDPVTLSFSSDSIKTEFFYCPYIPVTLCSV